MRNAGAFRGCVAWEWWLGPVWCKIYFPRYWRWNIVAFGFTNQNGDKEKQP